MNKLTFLIITILLITTSLFADENKDKWYSSFMEAGYLLGEDEVIYNENGEFATVDFSGLFYFSFGGSFKIFKILEIGGSISTYTNFNAILKWVPIYNKYTVFAKIHIYNFFDIGFEHWCGHSDINRYLSYFIPSELGKYEINNGSSKIYLRLEY